MKKLTKVLSLVLVIAMVVSLCVVGASAKTFTDYKPTDKTADYTEAIDVMSGVGIIEGMPSGNFEAAGNFNRAQAAKIIAYMQLGPAKAEALTFSANTAVAFKDVPTSFWAYKYIEYCAQQGIISGYGNGKFGPNYTLTGYQWAKMLLSAVGYGVNKEYNGANWAVNAARDGLKYGVFSAYTDVLAGSTPNTITRDVATAMAFNTLVGIPKVTYAALVGDYIDSTGSVYGGRLVNGITTNGTLGYTVFKLHNTADYNYATTKYVGEAPLVYSDDAFVVENAPAFTPNNVDYTMVGRVGHAWYVLGSYNRPVAVSNFYPTDALLGTSTDGTSFANLTTKGSGKYVASADSTVTTYVNGVKGAVPTYAKGTEVKLYDTNGNGKIDTVIALEKTVAVVGTSGVVYNTAKTKVTVAPIVTAYTSVAALDNFADLAAGDVVLYWTDVTGVTHFQKQAATKSQLTKVAWNSTDMDYNYTIGGKTYELSGLRGSISDSNLVAQGYNMDVNYYFDDFGYIVYAEAVASKLSDVVVLAAQGDVAGTGIYTGTTTHQGLLVKMDGTTMTVNMDQLYTVNSFYYYTVNAAGKYVLKTAAVATSGAQDEYKSTNAAQSTEGQISVTNTVSAITKSAVTTGTAAAAKTTFANTSTIYIYETVDGSFTYTAVTGLTNSPTTASTGDNVISVLYAPSGNVAKVVFMSYKPTVTNSGSTLFFVNPAHAYNKAGQTYNATSGAANGDGYVEYQVIDSTGALTTVKVTPDSQTTPTQANIAVTEGFNTPTYTTINSANIVTNLSAQAAPKYYGHGSGATDGGVMMVGGTGTGAQGYTYTATTPAFVVTIGTDGVATMEATTVGKLAADVNDTVYVVPMGTAAPLSTTAKAMYIIKNDEPAMAVVLNGANLNAGEPTSATAVTPYAQTGIYQNCAISYKWLLNGTDVTATVTSVYNPTVASFATAKGVALVKGDVIQCQATFTNATTGASYIAYANYTVA